MKKTKKKKLSHVEKMNALDEAAACCAHIATVAELLENCVNTDWLDTETAARTGSLLLSEAEKLTELVERLRKPKGAVLNGDSGSRSRHG